MSYYAKSFPTNEFTVVVNMVREAVASGNAFEYLRQHSVIFCHDGWVCQGWIQKTFVGDPDDGGDIVPIGNLGEDVEKQAHQLLQDMDKIPKVPVDLNGVRYIGDPARFTVPWWVILKAIAALIQLLRQ